MTAPDTRILIANNHPLIRRGLIDLLRIEYPRAVFGEAGNGKAAITTALGDDWDVVIVGSSLRDTNGIGVIKAIKAVKPAVPIVLTSWFPTPLEVLHAQNAGASAYVVEPDAGEELAGALRAVLAGGRYFFSDGAK